MRRRARRGAGAVPLRTLAGCAAAVASLFFGISADADQSEPASQADSELESVRDLVSDEGEEELSEPSWIPSIEIGFDTFDYKTDTEVASDISTLEPISFDPVTGETIFHGPTWTGSQSASRRQLMFRIGGELMGPMFEDLPGRPRLFVKGGARFRAFSSDDVFRIGKPFEIKQPENGLIRYENAGPRAEILPLNFPGQGSQIDAQFQDPSWYAGLGVAFSVPIATNLLLYVKPSFQYSMEEIDLSGAMTVVDEPDQSLGPDPSTEDRNCTGRGGVLPCVREFVLRRSRAEETTTDHSIGAELEVELVLFRKARPVRVSLYAGARFMWLLSDPVTRFADSPPSEGCVAQQGGTVDDFICTPFNETIASYSVMREDFGIRGGGGLRFSWVGFD